MAPAMQAVYLPDLDKCMSGEQPVISWYEVNNALRDANPNAQSTSLEHFLKNDQVLSILKNPFAAFPPPSSRSKSDFDTKTSAINTSGKKDAEQLKADAQWLSSEANLDEVAAFRVAIVEWQQRASRHLRTQWSDEEVVTLQHATYPGGSGAHSIRKLSTTQGKENRDTFNSDDERRKRLLAVLVREKDAILKVSETLVGFAQSQDVQVPEAVKGAERARIQSWMISCGRSVWQAQRAESDASKDGFFGQCVEALQHRLDAALDPSKWPKTVQSDSPLASVYTKGLLSEIVSILRLALLHQQALTDLAGTAQVVAWYEFMDRHQFFNEIGLINPEASDLTVIIHCLVSLVSTAMLQVSQALDYLQKTYSGPEKIAYPQISQKPYLDDDSCIKLLTEVLLGATSQTIRHAGPAALGWSLISQRLREIANGARLETPRGNEDGSSSPIVRRTSFRDSSSTKSRPEVLLDIVLDVVPGDDSIMLMGNGAVVDLGVFEVISTLSDVTLRVYSEKVDIHTAVCGRLVLFQLMKEAIPIATYGPDVVQAVLSLLSYEAATSATFDKTKSWPAQPASKLLEDAEVMGPRFMEQVIGRYPYELPPFLATLGAVGKSISSIDEDGSRISYLLDNMPTMTTILPTHFEDYDLFAEDETNNTVQLTGPLDVFVPAKAIGYILLADRSSASALSKLDGMYAIPAGTLGIVLNSSKPLVVRWQHQHSALEYLGVLLSTRMSGTAFVEASSASFLDMETAAEIIALMSSLLEASISAEDAEATKQLLGRFSNGLPRNDDIIRVVTDLFDEEMQDMMNRPGSEASVSMLAQCVRFIRSVFPVFPERIWSYLGRSRLLAINETTSAFATIVGATEVPLGQFVFLRSCLALFDDLVNDAFKRTVSRNGVNVKAVTRFSQPTAQSGSTPEKLLSSVLSTFQVILLDVLQSKANWRFNDPIESVQISTSILRSSNQILIYGHGIDDSAQGSAQKLTSTFQTTAQTITAAFIADTAQEMTIRPIIDIFLAAVAEPSTEEGSDLPQIMLQQTLQALSLCTTILKVGTILDTRGKRLMTALFQAIPIISRLYAISPSLKASTAELLTALVQSANFDGKEPPSLLGHLSSESSKLFLTVVSQLDLPLHSLDTEAKIWDMLSAIVSSKQQWLAICLLTGTTPRERLSSKETEKAIPEAKPLLSLALDQLSKIGLLAPRRAIAMLAFVSHAQNHWTWATNDIGRHNDFIPAVTNWVNELSSTSSNADSEAAIRTANENQMAAFVADILATYLHSARQSGGAEIVKSIASKLGFLRDKAVNVDAYNHSLHKNLAKNFGQKFPSCTLANFKRTTLQSADFGPSYYYDIELATKMLDFEPSWSRQNGQGFVNEVGRANINLSVVESQIAMLKSWRSLAIELSAFASDNVQLQKDLAKVVIGCLKANMETAVPAMVFENVQEIRAELAFVLMQRLINIRSKEPEVRDIVSVAWDAVRTCGLDFDVISTSRDATYYRTLLQILFLSLQPQIHSPAESPANLRKSMSAGAAVTKNASTESELTPILLEILQRPIASNFRALCSAVHSQPVDDGTASIVGPSDFVLLTALLQTVLRIPAIQAANHQVASIIASTGLLRLGVSLYSWSDSISPDSSDPIYGELSILFLLTLSTLPMVAQHLAVEGILSHLSSANLSAYYRQTSGKGPFDSPQRLHSIWTRGILPLCLNLLEHVGPGIASEVSSFLNSFSQQLRRAEADLSVSSTAPSIRNPHAGSLTLNLAAETQSLALISTVLERLRTAGPAIGVVGSEIPPLAYDRSVVKEEIVGALRSRRALRERIVPVGEREGAWARAKSESSGSETVLEERVVVELEGARDCLLGL
ncbi:hypothetical protein MBLNU457_6633t3 [Dothideomycetes sp. NU457]